MRIVLVCQVVPGTTTEILVLPFCLSFFGAFAWWTGLNSLDRGGRGWGRIPGSLLLALGVIRGGQLVWNLYNPRMGEFYRLTLSKKMYLAHFIALLMPLAVAALLYVYSGVLRRRNLDDL